MGVQRGFLPAEGQGAQVGSRAPQVPTSIGPFCVWPHLCLGSLAHVILANLGCQLDRIWDQLKNASGLFILKDLLLKGEDPSPELVASSGQSPDTKREKAGFLVLLPSPASSVCCWHSQNPASSVLQHRLNVTSRAFSRLSWTH